MKWKNHDNSHFGRFFEHNFNPIFVINDCDSSLTQLMDQSLLLSKNLTIQLSALVEQEP